MTYSLPRLVLRRLAAVGAATVLALTLSGGSAFAFGGGGGRFGRGHGGGHFDGHGSRGFHHGFDGLVVVPFGFGYGYGYYGPYYTPTPYDTYCNPYSGYYDPRWCYDYYDD